MALVAFEIAIAGLELGLCVIELLTWPGFEWTCGELGPLTRAFRLADIVTLIFLVHLVATIYPLFRDYFRGTSSSSGSKFHLYFRVFAINMLLLLISFMHPAVAVRDWARLRVTYNLLDVQAHFGDFPTGFLLLMKSLASVEPWGTALILVAAVVAITLCPAEFLALKLIKRVMDRVVLEDKAAYGWYLHSRPLRVITGIMIFASSFAFTRLAGNLFLAPNSPFSWIQRGE